MIFANGSMLRDNPVRHSIRQEDSSSCWLDQLGRSNYQYSLGKHAYSNILKILPPKNENFQRKMLIFFIFLLKT